MYGEFSQKKKRVAVFGIFDGIHDGHRDFFRQARECGDELIAIVGRDKVAAELKGRKPRYPQEQRRQLLLQEEFIDGAVIGDEELSSYEALERLNPAAIGLGYDQRALQEDLKRWMEQRGKTIPLHVLKPYKPEIFHNSFLK